MRLRVGAVLCLFLAFLGVGCRKSLAPNADNNFAPETWITAAPQDTITVRDNFGQPIPPVIGRIPVKFHLYWAGADRDGAIAGFYWAVTETLAVPPGDGLPLPALPGPKARDYHFTTRTDSSFIFRASEDVPERQHAFFIYAVDNKGRPDPTPARFIFRAYDRFPPLAVIDSLVAIGRTYRLLAGGGVTPEIRRYYVTDSFDIARPFPRDTVPSGATLYIYWHGEPTVFGNNVTGYRYKLDEPDFNVVDTTVKSVVYNTGVGRDIVSPGLKKFTLRAVGQSGWRGQATRYFQMNFAPDEWFSGPDPNDVAGGWTTYTDGNGTPYWYKDVNWSFFGGVTGTLLSADSASTLPAYRTRRRTFFEIYEDRLWAHQEGDTVHLNSWVIIPSGGFDKDSDYRVKVGTDPNKPPGVVTTPDVANGSPIGFRGLVQTRRSPDGSAIRPTESTTFPVFDIASVFHNPVISLYAGMTTSGQAFGYAAAEDGDGTIDRTLEREGGPVAIVDAVARGTATAGQIAARQKIMVFYVNHAPYLLTNDGAFHPRVNEVFPSRLVSFNLLAADSDPIDDTKGISRVGGPQQPPSPVLVRSVDITGKNSAGRDTTFNIVTNVEFANIPAFQIPTDIVSGACTARITLRDYRLDPISHAPPNFGGREVITDIPFSFVGSVPDNASEAMPSTQRPGSPQAAGRR